MSRLFSDSRVKRGVGQTECGEHAHTRHVQAYVEFVHPVRPSFLKRLLPRAHIEKRRGTAREAWDYCSKDRTRVEGWKVEVGSPPPSGAGGTRTDLRVAVALVQSTGRVRPVAEQYPIVYIKYFKGLEKYCEMLAKPRSGQNQPVVLVFYGRPGTGKSRHAHDHYPDAFWVPIQQGRTTWFDGYTGQSAVIFDDYNGELPVQHLLRILDRYPLRVPVKGGFIDLLDTTTHFIFTTNYMPDAWYNWEGREETKRALLRRITEVKVFLG